MGTLKIIRINKNKFQVRDGETIVKECSTFKAAMNALISGDIDILDNMDEFNEIEDMDLKFYYDGLES